MTYHLRRHVHHLNTPQLTQQAKPLAEKKQGAQAVVRALRILKLFNGKQTQLSLSDIVKITALNRTTVFRLLSTLVDEGFLVRHEDGPYHLGPELTALGGLASRTDNLRQLARPILKQLVSTVDERATLEILSKNPAGQPTMLVIDEIDASHRLSISDFAGSHLPVYATSTGKAYLAHLPSNEVDQILNEPLDAFTSNTLITKTALKQELNQIKEQGYAIANEELESGLVAIGVPIFDGQGTAHASICLAGPTVRMTAEKLPQLIQQLQNAGDLLSEKMGYRN